MKIVIMDTGIDVNNNKFAGISGVAIIRISENEFKAIDSKHSPECINDNVGHGTAIANIILNHNKCADIFVVKLFDDALVVTDEGKLIFALNYVLQNIDFDILNLSLGLTSVSDDAELHKICEEYRKNNKIIISAFDNNGALSYPASYSDVIGVTSEYFCNNVAEYYTVDDDRVNICANGLRQRVMWKDGTFIFSSGNSYACAHFTGIFSLFFDPFSNVSLQEQIVKHSFGNLSIDHNPNRNPKDSPVSGYKRAVLFPFNKEMHSLIRFEDNLPFEIIDVYDTKYSARIGASTNLLLNLDSKKNHTIKSIETIDMESFDTLIWGHTDKLFLYSNPINRKVFLRELLKKGKQIYSFEDISEFIIDLPEYRDNLFMPIIDDTFISGNPFGKLHIQNKPVVGIFGTSSKQGKFTLQLKLRYELLSRGYKICQLGTEPSSLLYGMDIVFPNGYMSTVSLTTENMIYYLNEALYTKSRNSDLILVGGQSGVVMRDISNIKNYDYSQIEFIGATQPDICILCFNSFDTIDLIIRNIKAIESIVDSKVIAGVIFPYYYDNDDIIHQKALMMSHEIFSINFKNKFEQALGMPVFFPNDNSAIRQLCDYIISYLTE